MDTKEHEEKESFLYKKLDLGFVYIFIFLLGIAIILFMINYINKKIQDYSNGTTIAVVTSNRTFV